MNEKILVAYWSGTGNTEKMAQSIAAGIGGMAELLPITQVDAASVGNYAKLAFGCPSMGAEVLEEAEFEPAYEAMEKQLAGKRVALFGSYGWGDGEWMRDWEKRVERGGAVLFEEGLIINEAPDGEGVEDCKMFGKRFAQI